MIELSKLKNIQNAYDLLSTIFPSGYSLPIDVKQIAQSIQNVCFSDHLTLNDYLKSGYIKVNRNNDSTVKDIKIWVNSSESQERQRFTIAHELGHLIYHIAPNLESQHDDEIVDMLNRSSNYTDFKETTANKFAAQLLMPKDDLESEVTRLIKLLKAQQYPVTWVNLIERLASRFDVSQDAMTYRLINLGYPVKK